MDPLKNNGDQPSPPTTIDSTIGALNVDNTDKTIKEDRQEVENIQKSPSKISPTKSFQNSIGYDSILDHKELTYTIWGDYVKQDVFERWSQDGGPCSIIACVQAFLLRELLFCSKCGNEWRKPTDDELRQHLSDGLLSIFINVSSENPKYLVFYEDENPETAKENNSNDTFRDEDISNTTTSSKNPKRAKLDYDAFTKRLRLYKFETLNELKVKLYEKIDHYKKEYGVLCFLYSLLLTKKLEILKKELEESQESLINPLHGHGSQSLTNLMLCGVATSNVFDGDRFLEGLKLQGIHRQSSIGFLTIMEYLRYCEVGWNLKNPKFPIFILASETHLTVFFSKETSLVQKNESSRQLAIKKFQLYDPYENGFVKTEDLEKLMESLDLLTDKEYVDIVKQQLDNENLGIITKSAFLNEFYPESEPNSIPNSFSVYHYNGLARSNADNEVQYSHGLAKIIDFTDQPKLDLNSIKNCLQTKWPTIEVDWISSKTPSLN